MIFLFAALGPMTAGVCHALFVPSGLNPGDIYRLMFVTEGAVDARSADINRYNRFVQEQADSSALTTGTTRKAVVSVFTGLNARENTGTQILDTVDIFNLNDDLLTYGTADLYDGMLTAPMLYDMNAMEVSGTAWTGSLADGTALTGQQLGVPRAVGNLVQSGVLGVTSGKWLSWTGARI